MKFTVYGRKMSDCSSAQHCKLYVPGNTGHMIFELELRLVREYTVYGSEILLDTVWKRDHDYETIILYEVITSNCVVSCNV
jgi:hypothetical protein